MLKFNRKIKPVIIGKKVRIKKNINHRQRYDGIYIHPDMKRYFGKTAIIIKKEENMQGSEPGYRLNIDNGEWFWSKTVLKPIE